MKNNVKLISLCLGLASLALGQTTTAPIYTMSILAGIPTPNSLGDNGLSTFATVSSPQAIVLDKNGNIFIADNNNSKIRRIDAVTGIITTYASTGIAAPTGLAFDHEGNLWVAQTGNSAQLLRITTPVATTSSTGVVTPPGAIATTCTVTATSATGTCVMASNQNVTNVYGGDQNYAYNAWFDGINQIAIDNNDNVYIADTTNNRIRMIRNVNNCIYTPSITGNQGSITNTCLITTIAGFTSGISSSATPNLSPAQTTAWTAAGTVPAAGTTSSCGTTYTDRKSVV